jgi:hypothetical protein
MPANKKARSVVLEVKKSKGQVRVKVGRKTSLREKLSSVVKGK